MSISVPGRAALLLALAFSLSLNVVLARRAGAQRLLLDEARLEMQPLRGELMPPLEGRDRDGAPMSVAYDGRPTILYAFSPTCHFCEVNAPSLAALASQLGDQYRVVGVSLDREGLDAYLESRQLPFETVVYGASPSSIAAYDLGVTPQTIVISPGGRVLRNWKGVYEGEQRTAVENYFGVILPGHS